MAKINITTKTGDKGTSRLFSGEEVSKDSLRLDAYGDLDELVSILSVARHQMSQEVLRADILTLQKEIFTVAAELATTKNKLQKLPHRVDQNFLNKLEKRREALAQTTDIPTDFVIPGATLSAAYLDLARAISRRCERKAVRLFEQNEIDNSLLIIWLNRLSDYLYLVARNEEKKPMLVKSI